MKKLSYLRILSIAMAVILMLSLAGCQGTDSEIEGKPTDKATEAPSVTPTTTPDNTEELEPVVLEWYNYTFDRPDTEMVMEQLNEYLKEKINATVNYHFFNSPDYTSKMATIITSGQNLDIAWCNSTRLPYPENAQKGAFMAIEDMMGTYAPKTIAEIPDYLWDAHTIDGHIYGIPAMKDLAQRWDMEFNKTMADELGVDATQAWASVNDLVPMLYEAKAAKDEKFPEDKDIPLSRRVISDTRAYYPRDMIVGLAVTDIPGVNAFKDMGDGETVFNIYATDEYRHHSNLMKQLVDDGIFPFDSENYDTENVLRDQGKLFMNLNAGMMYLDPHAYGEDFEYYLNNSTVATMINQNLQGSIHVISATSKNPERALMLIELLNTDKFVADTLRYGIEDTHFNYDADGDVYFSDSQNNKDSSNYGYFQSTGWFLGSVFTASPLASNIDTYNDLVRKLNENAISDTNLGFMFDTTPVTNEIAACNNIIAEYDKPLMSGMLDEVDSVVDDFVAKLNAAGAQKIVDEAQNQLTAWRASTGKTTK